MKMIKSALSVFIFSLYLLLIGAGLALVPNMLLAWFGLAATQEVWIRVVGMLVFILGVYYLLAARTGFKPFFQWTVYGRMAGSVAYLALVLFKLAPAIFIWFAIVDLLTALWTYHCLRTEGRQPGS